MDRARFDFLAFLDNSLKNGFKMILVSWLSVTNTQCSKFSFKREISRFPCVLAFMDTATRFDFWAFLDNSLKNGFKTIIVSCIGLV